MSGNDDELQQNAPPPPLVPADPAQEVGGGGDVDMDGMGGGDGGLVVGGGLGGGQPAPVVNPLLQQQQQMVPQQNAPLPLQMPPQQHLMLQRVRQQLMLRQFLGNVQGVPGVVLGGPPGGVLPDIPQLPLFKLTQGGAVLGPAALGGPALGAGRTLH